MRHVKTPWIDALTQSREGAKGGQAPEAAPRDLTPHKMSETYYSEVSC